MGGPSFQRSAPGTPEAVPALIEAIEAWLDRSGVPAGEAARLMIAFDEILSNIARHGGDTVDIGIDADDAGLTATIADNGAPFDPLARAAPDTGLSIDDRAIGGLGIHLVREMMDDVGYAYEQGRNKLTFRKTF